MKIIARAVKILFLIALLVLAGCAQQGLSVSEYHAKIIETLNKDQSPPGAASTEGSGFAAMILLLLSDMTCMGDTCISGVRFAHLRELADQDRFQLANYRGQICDEKLQPPRSELQTHQAICSALDQIFHQVDSIMTTSALALQLLGNNPTATPSQAGAGVELALDGAASNLSHYEDNIRKSLTELQQITWLKPALPSLP
jgi:hypothetical protein